MLPITEGVILRHFQYMTIRDLSPETIKSRRSALRRLSRWLDGPVLYVTADQLVEWQVERSRDVCPATRRTELSNVRAFYSWVRDEGFRDDDPSARLPMPRAPRGLPRPIPDPDLSTALDAADATMGVILGLAGFAGLRACEVARLAWSSVSLGQERPMLRVERGKGNHARDVDVSSALAALLVALPHRVGPVIPRGDGGRGHNTANAITKRASTHFRDLGMPYTLHQLRHRLATVMYRACLDIQATADTLGHLSTTTTSIYASASRVVTADGVEAAGTLAA